jgi:hypothetical protein
MTEQQPDGVHDDGHDAHADGETVDAATVLPAEPEYVAGGSRRRKRSRLPGCLAVLVALGLIGGGLWFAGTKVTDFVSDRFSSAPDYDGPGRGRVLFEVSSGDTGSRTRTSSPPSTPASPPPRPTASRPASRSASTRCRRRWPPPTRSTCWWTPPTC